MKSFENFLASILSEDFGKLILRFTIGILMLFHGYHKYEHGIDGIKSLVTKNGFPELLAYGVYIGEIVVPILIIIGLYTRVSSLIYAFTMAFAIYLAHSSQLFAFNTHTGALIIESALLYMLAALALMFLGAGKIGLDKK